MKYCKDCKYFTGVQCHGHGDFWGECKRNKSKDYFSTICWDDSLCKYDPESKAEILRLKKEQDEYNKEHEGMSLVEAFSFDLGKIVESTVSDIRKILFGDKKEEK